MDLKILNTKESPAEWDNYVNKSENGTFYHTSAWLNIIEDTLEVEPIHTIIYNKNKEILLFPLFLERRSLHSPFYCDYGGPCLLDLHSNMGESFILLDKFVDSIGKKKKATRIYIRPHYTNIDYLIYLNDAQYRIASKHNTYVLSNLENIDDICNLFHKKTRNAIRKVLKYDVSIDPIQTDDTRNIAIYYDLYLKTKEKQGASPLPFAFFEKLQSIPPKNVLMYLAKYDGAYRAGLLSFVHNGTIYVFDNCSDPIYSSYNLNYKLYYHLIQYAKEKKLDIDFGRTSLDDIDLNRFKERWGGKLEEYNTYMKITPPVSINIIKIGIEYANQHGLIGSVKKLLKKRKND